MQKAMENDTILATKKINIFLTFFIVIVGLCGHFLTILVYSKKRFRLNSSQIFLLCLAINDSLFLIVHFFEDTNRTIHEAYFSSSSSSSSSYYSYENSTSSSSIESIFKKINIIDNFNIACSLVNYLRYVLRTNSAYIIIGFTIQHLFIIYKPLRTHFFNSKKSAWFSVLFIITISCFINIWVLFMFEIKEDVNSKLCDVIKSKRNYYFHYAFIYILITMILPICLIFVCNYLIILKLNKEKKLRKQLCTASTRKVIQKPLRTVQDEDDKNKIIRVYKPFYLNIDHITNKVKSRKNKNTSRIIKRLVIISSIYVLLHLPYVIIWNLFFFQTKKIDQDLKILFYSILQIFEIFYILNYGIYFFINFASSAIFRFQIKYSCKYMHKFIFYLIYIIKI